MKKNIKQLLAFLLVLLFIVYAVQYGIDFCYKNIAANKFAKMFRHEVDAEVMIFGSSLANHQFDPAIIKDTTGHSVYNMGGDGLFFIQYNALIREYISYEKQCKYLVIACNFQDFHFPSLITRPDLYLPYLSNSNVYEALQQIQPHDIFHARYLPGYKLTMLTKDFYYDIVFASHEQYGISGYMPISSDLVVADSNKNLRKGHNEETDAKIFDQFRSTVESITAKGIKVVLVIAPVQDNSYRFISNTEWIKARYRSLANNNVHFLDYSTDSMSRSKEYFYNYNHLNATGAAVFSNIFAKDLVKIMHE